MLCFLSNCDCLDLCAIAARTCSPLRYSHAYHPSQKYAGFLPSQRGAAPLEASQAACCLYRGRIFHRYCMQYNYEPEDCTCIHSLEDDNTSCWSSNCCHLPGEIGSLPFVPAILFLKCFFRKSKKKWAQDRERERGRDIYIYIHPGTSNIVLRAWLHA